MRSKFLLIVLFVVILVLAVISVDGVYASKNECWEKAYNPTYLNTTTQNIVTIEHAKGYTCDLAVDINDCVELTCWTKNENRGEWRGTFNSCSDVDRYGTYDDGEIGTEDFCEGCGKGAAAIKVGDREWKLRTGGKANNYNSPRWSTCTYNITAPCADGDADGFADLTCGGTDCNDADPDVFPGADELCDDKDNQCLGNFGYGEVDEGCVVCGDGVQGGSEECDDGTENNGVECLAIYGGSCDYCSSSCELTNVLGESCGDSIINGVEVCDDGANGNDTDGCFDDCTFTYCGDEIIQTLNGDGGAEVCDDGTENNGNYGFCKTDCTDVGPSCGDTTCDVPDEDVNSCEVDCIAVYWAYSDGNFLPVTPVLVVLGSTELLMVWNNTGLIPGDMVNFEIKENDLFNDDDIRVGENAIVGTVGEDGNVNTTWIPTSGDMDKTSDYGEFYFIPFGPNSEGGEKSKEIEINSTFVDPCISYYSGCGFANTEDQCGQANRCAGVPQASFPKDMLIQCGTIYDSVTGCEVTTNCFCVWDEDGGGDGNGACGPDWDDTISKCDDPSFSDPLTIGECFLDESVSDTCDDSFLTYGWEGIWTWDSSNVFTTTEIDSSNIDYVNDSSGGSIIVWHFDPFDETGLRISEACTSGDNIVPCPQQVQLPFFGLYGIIMSISIIFLVYTLLLGTRKKPKFIK